MRIWIPIMKRNARKMLQRASELGVKLRPHVKTHKTIEVALWQTGGERSGIVVSTLAEARAYADAGFDDIVYAVPITKDKLEEAAMLGRKLKDFSVAVDNIMAVENIIDWEKQNGLGKPWNVVVMVDCGYGREGVDPNSQASIDLIKAIDGNSRMNFKGLYTHGGNSYDCDVVEGVRRIGENERDSIVALSRKIEKELNIDMKEKMRGVGSTPTCSNPPDHLNGLNEIHPGNYIYYDVMQADLKSCTMDDIGVSVATRVIGHYPSQGLLLIDMGWTGISAQGKERGYGFIKDHPELQIKKLSQESGVVGGADKTVPLDLSRFPIGTMLFVLPFHSCAATAMHEVVNVLDENNPEYIVAQWKIFRGW